MSSSAVSSAKPAKDRLLYLDLLRCLSILAVTVMHASAPLLFSDDTVELLSGMTYSSLCLFCVPVLLMISGALMLGDSRPVSLSAFYSRRLTKILIPLLAWSVIYYVVLCIQVGDLPNVITFFKRFFTGLWSGPLWFLYMIAGVYLMVPFLRPVFGGASTRTSLTFVAIIFGIQALNVVTRLAFELDVNRFFTGSLFPYYFGYFILGNVLARADFKMPGGRASLAALFLACAAVTVLGEFVAKSGDNTMLPNTFYSYQEPLVAVMAACIFLFFKDWNPSMDRKRARLVHSLSCLSYGVFLSHVLVLMLLTGQIPLVFRHGAGLDCHTASPLAGPLLTGLATFTGAALLTAAIKRVPGLSRIIP